MALTRKLLQSMGLEEDKISSIIEAHTETVEGLKEKANSFKDKADKFDAIKDELAESKKKIEAYENDDDWKTKYEQEHKDFEAFKKDKETERVNGEKDKAYRKLLSDSGVSEKLIDLIIKGTDISSITLENGAIKDADKLSEDIKKTYSDYIVTKEQNGAKTHTPPVNDGEKKGYNEIFKRNDKGRYEMSTAERQKAIAEKLEAETE